MKSREETGSMWTEQEEEPIKKALWPPRLLPGISCAEVRCSGLGSSLSGKVICLLNPQHHVREISSWETGSSSTWHQGFSQREITGNSKVLGTIVSLIHNPERGAQGLFRRPSLLPGPNSPLFVFRSPSKNLFGVIGCSWRENSWAMLVPGTNIRMIF